MSLQLRPGVTWAETGYGGVLLDTASGQYWTLNRTGAAVVTSLLDGADERRAVAVLAETFDAEADVLAADVAGIVDGLTAAALLVRR